MQMISEDLAPGARGGSGLLLVALSFLPLLLVGAWFLWAAQSSSAQLLDATFLFLCH